MDRAKRHINRAGEQRDKKVVEVEPTTRVFPPQVEVSPFRGEEAGRDDNT
jgi:hypothetical protein